MSHFAQIENGIVINVIVAEQDYIDTISGIWVQTSYNTRGGIHYAPNSSPPVADDGIALRYNFASIGFNYDSTVDAFYSPQPLPSWILNTTTYIWEPPVPMPTDGTYVWDETTISWEKVKLASQENN